MLIKWFFSKENYHIYKTLLVSSDICVQSRIIVKYVVWATGAWGPLVGKEQEDLFK